MGKIISVTNQKGGVGKTTTVGNIAAAFGEKEKKVLMIDLDPQAGLTTSFGFQPFEFQQTIYHVFLRQKTIADVTVSTNVENVSLVPSNLDLSGAEAELIGQAFWASILGNALVKVIDQYDIILLDCPPSLGVLTTNAIVACHLVLVPLQCEFLALRAIPLLQKIVEELQDGRGKAITTLVVRTMYDGRTNQSQEVSKEIERAMGEQVLQTKIKRTVQVADASSWGQPIVQYNKNSDVARAYRDVAEEVLKYV